MVNYYCYYIHLTAFFSRKTWVSRHKKCKPFWILLEQEMMGWQWHQLDHMQVICTSLQTDNHSACTANITKMYWLRNHKLSRMVIYWRCRSDGGNCAGLKKAESLNEPLPSPSSHWKLLVQLKFWGMAPPGSRITVFVCGVRSTCLSKWGDHLSGRTAVDQKVRDVSGRNLVVKSCLLLSSCSGLQQCLVPRAGSGEYSALDSNVDLLVFFFQNRPAPFPGQRS